MLFDKIVMRTSYLFLHYGQVYNEAGIVGCTFFIYEPKGSISMSKVLDDLSAHNNFYSLYSGEQ